MNKNNKVLVAGGTGLVGSAIIRKLLEKGYTNIISTYHTKLPDTCYMLPANCFYKIDLTNQQEAENFFKQHHPEYVFLAAAKVGGIVANNIYRADFIYQNLQIQNNVIYNAYKYKAKKLTFLGSTCIYPKNCPQPIKEEYLLTGELEYTNEPYAIAKIAGIKMCESFNLQYGTNFISVMPTNLYGENDNFDLEKSHVLPALIRKIHLGKALKEDNWDEIRKNLDKNPIENIDGKTSKENILKILDKYGIKIAGSKLAEADSKNQTAGSQNQIKITNCPPPDSGSVSIEIWGSGKPKREFLYSDDMADACVYLMEKINIKDMLAGSRQQEQEAESGQQIENTNYPIPSTHFLNIGTGKDLSIKDLAYLIKDIIGYHGKFCFNTSKPDGTMRKVTDVTKLHNLGWRHTIELKEGIERIYKWYVES